MRDEEVKQHLKSIDDTLQQIDKNNVLFADRLKPSELWKQHINRCGTDLTLLTLKGHLIIESLLEINLCRLLAIEHLPEEYGKLGFNQKLQLLCEVIVQRESGPDPEPFIAIDNLNWVRNQLAHNLKNPEQIESDVKWFINDCRKRGYVKSVPDGVTSDQLKHCIFGLCKFLDKVRVHLFKLETQNQ